MIACAAAAATDLLLGVMNGDRINHVSIRLIALLLHRRRNTTEKKI